MEQIDDGAALQPDGTIVGLGSFADLRCLNPDVPVIGSGEEVVLAGFVNGHRHGGLTPVELGAPDMPLELWFATRLVTGDLDLYLDPSIRHARVPAEVVRFLTSTSTDFNWPPSTPSSCSNIFTPSITMISALGSSPLRQICIGVPAKP
jgi:hypothetical protein